MNAGALPPNVRHRRVAGTFSGGQGTAGWTIEPPRRGRASDLPGYRSAPVRRSETLDGSLKRRASQPQAT